MDIWAILPVKSLVNSKRRLSHLLPAKQRAILIHSLLTHQLAVLVEISWISQVLIVSSDPIVWRLARQFDARIAKETQPYELNSAVTRGMNIAASQGAEAALMLPVDLPFIQPSDVETLIAAGLQKMNPQAALVSMSNDFNPDFESSVGRNILAICSDEAGMGTNALLLNPITAFKFQFGPNSYRLHIQEAQKRGITIQTVSTPGLQFDLDDENDWFAYKQLVSMPNM